MKDKIMKDRYCLAQNEPKNKNTKQSGNENFPACNRRYKIALFSNSISRLIIEEIYGKIYKNNSHDISCDLHISEIIHGIVEYISQFLLLRFSTVFHM